MRQGPVLAVLAMLACNGGGASDGRTPPQQQKMKLSPPPANALPDAGFTADGKPASDSDRVLVNAQWFATQIDTCSIQGVYQAGTRNYDQVRMNVNGVGSQFPSLDWILSGSTGASAYDTFRLDIDLANARFAITDDAAHADFVYQKRIGEADDLVLTVSKNGEASMLRADRGDSNSWIECKSL